MREPSRQISKKAEFLRPNFRLKILIGGHFLSSRTQTRRGNIFVETFEIFDVFWNFSPFLHPWKRCESRVYFLGSKKKCLSENSETFSASRPWFLFRKQCFFLCLSEKQRPLVSQDFAKFIPLYTKIYPARECFSQNVSSFCHFQQTMKKYNVSSMMFLRLPRA